MIIELDDSDPVSVIVYLMAKTEISASGINLKGSKITLRVFDKYSIEHTINCNPVTRKTIVTPLIYEEFNDDFDLKPCDIGVKYIDILDEHGAIEVPHLKELIKCVGTLKGYFYVEYSSGERISIPSGDECMVIKEAEKESEQK